jgi:hypothetical protein
MPDAPPTKSGRRRSGGASPAELGTRRQHPATSRSSRRSRQLGADAPAAGWPAGQRQRLLPDQTCRRSTSTSCVSCRAGSTSGSIRPQPMPASTGSTIVDQKRLSYLVARDRDASSRGWQRPPRRLGESRRRRTSTCCSPTNGQHRRGRQRLPAGQTANDLLAQHPERHPRSSAKSHLAASNWRATIAASKCMSAIR